MGISKKRIINTISSESLGILSLLYQSKISITEEEKDALKRDSSLLHSAYISYPTDVFFFWELKYLKDFIFNEVQKAISINNIKIENISYPFFLGENFADKTLHLLENKIFIEKKYEKDKDSILNGFKIVLKFMDNLENDIYPLFLTYIENKNNAIRKNFEIITSKYRNLLNHIGTKQAQKDILLFLELISFDEFSDALSFRLFKDNEKKEIGDEITFIKSFSFYYKNFNTFMPFYILKDRAYNPDYIFQLSPTLILLNSRFKENREITNFLNIFFLFSLSSHYIENYLQKNIKLDKAKYNNMNINKEIDSSIEVMEKIETISDFLEKDLDNFFINIVRKEIEIDLDFFLKISNDEEVIRDFLSVGFENKMIEIFEIIQMRLYKNKKSIPFVEEKHHVTFVKKRIKDFILELIEIYSDKLKNKFLIYEENSNIKSPKNTKEIDVTNEDIVFEKNNQGEKNQEKKEDKNEITEEREDIKEESQKEDISEIESIIGDIVVDEEYGF